MLTTAPPRRLTCAIAIAIVLPCARASAQPSTGASQPEADPEPSADELAAAPPADRASGIARDHERDEGAARRAGRVLLWAPRELLELGLWVPDALAGRTDSYLESRGPNVFARGEGTGGWSGGAMVAWEQPFGPSVGARVGHSVGRYASADVTAIAFGRHGYTGRLGVEVEPADVVRVDLEGEAAHARETAFAGIGDHELGDPGDAAVVLDPFADGAVPEVIVDDDAITARASVPVALGPFEIRPGARYERHDLRPDGDFPYDRAALPGLADPFGVAVGSLDVVVDRRRAPYPWIPESAPATGWRVRASASYTLGAGETDGAGDLRFARWGASAERLFDLFRGTRVLILRARVEAVTGDREQIPFVLLPSLGGPDALRAFSRGRFRDAAATSGEVVYEWATGHNARAALFVEEGGVHPDAGDLETDNLHLSAGGWFRLVFDGGTAARFVIAGSDTAELGLYVVLGGV